MKKYFWVLFLGFIFLFGSCTSKEEDRELIKKEFDEKIESFCKDIEDFSLRTEINLEYRNKDTVVHTEKIGSQTVKVGQTPLYMEFSTGGSSTTMLYLEENGDVASYEINETGPVKRKYVSSLTDFKQSILYEEAFIDFNFDGMESNIFKKQEDTYTFSFTLNELLEKMPDLGLEEILPNLGELEKQILDTPWSIEIAIYSEIIKVSLGCFFPIDLEAPEDKLGIKIELFYSKMKIDRIDVTRLAIDTPQSIEDVYKTTLINRYFIVENGYYRFKLEPGKYAIDATNHELNGLDAKLFNEEKEELPIGIGVDAQFSSIEEFVFDIEKAGTYYLFLSTYNPIRCKIKSLNYTSFSSIKNPIELKNTSGEIEGKFDFRVYNYSSETEGVLCIENKKDTPIFAILPQYRYDYISQIDCQNYTNESWTGKKYIRIKPGDNYIILSSDYDAIDFSYSYEFTIDFLQLENGYEENYEDLEKITEEYSSLTYMSGLCLSKNPRLSLEVTEKAMYIFETQPGEENMTLDFTIEAVEGKVISTGSASAFLLDPGTYIVNIVNNDHVFGIGKVRYRTVSIENRDVEVEVKEGNIEELYTETFPSILGEKVIQEQTIRYCFTLTETSKLLYRNLVFYDMDGMRLSLSVPEDYYMDIIELPAGKYYFMIYNESPNDGTPKFKYTFAKVNVELAAAYNPYHLVELELDKPVSLTPLALWDKQYFKVTITETGMYTFNQAVSIFNEDKNYIPWNPYIENYTKELSGGTYYITCQVFSSYQLVISKK